MICLPASLGHGTLIIDGGKDTRRSPGDGSRLAERLTRDDATAPHPVVPVDHVITAMYREIARKWLKRLQFNFWPLCGSCPD
jgi:predicted esterase